MTWNRVATSHRNVAAYAATSESVTLSIGTDHVALSFDDAASLGGYLLAITGHHEVPAKPAK